MTHSWEGIPLEGPILRPTAAAKYLGISLSKYYVLVKEGDAPPLIKLCGRASGTPRGWLDKWLVSRLQVSSSISGD